MANDRDQAEEVRRRIEEERRRQVELEERRRRQEEERKRIYRDTTDWDRPRPPKRN